MLKNKVMLLSLICFLSVLPVQSKLSLTELNMPKDPAYRVGISDLPETQYIQAQENITEPSEPEINLTQNNNSIDTNYADLSIKRLSKEISQNLVYEEKDMVSDLTLLWQGAAVQSDTINFALYKLANPDADKPNKSTVKNVLKTIASVSTIAGASMANPLLAGTSLIGGNFLNIMSQDTKSLNYKYTKVSDADMIILIRKVEDLQQNAVNLYYDYMTAKKQLEMATNIVQERRKKFETAQKNNASREIVVVTDAYFRTAVDRQKTARSEFLSKRAALEQFVGNEAFTQFENELAEREMSQRKVSEEESIAYDRTIQGVEAYKNNLASLDGINLRPKNTDITEEHSSNDYDVNLDKMQDIPPLDVPSENVSKSQTKNGDVADKKVKNKKEKKESKYSTKGLIFVHDSVSQPQASSAQQEKEPTSAGKKKKTQKGTKSAEKNINSSVDKSNVSEPKKQKFNGVELLPLDDLKAPNYYKNGSIFAE